MRFEIINEVLDWGWQTGILSLGTKEKQADKVVEEARELREAVEGDNLDKICEEIGDVHISAILAARMYGVSSDQCVRMALEKNKNRPEGKMLDGEYVREK